MLAAASRTSCGSFVRSAITQGCRRSIRRPRSSSATPCGTPSERRGETRHVLERRALGERRNLRQFEGAGRRILDPPGGVDGRGPWVGESVPVRGAVPELPRRVWRAGRDGAAAGGRYGDG